MWFVGDSDFVSTGEEFLGHFRHLAALSAHDRVLDVGCGIGRMARVLAGVLEPPGSYDGFDVVPQGIDWCRAHYTDTRAPFRFNLADLRNAAYNPDGRVAPLDYRFPYADASFDLVLATSLFTHLLSDTADHYLAETARVLAPGGRALSTWFLLDAGRPPRAQTALAFAHAVGPARVVDPEQPEKVVAHREAWLHERLAAYGLRLRGPVLYGTWAGHAGASLQDIVVAERPEP
jgi:SAM-dependent methyltransferase